jgi:hypothetical protein
MKKNNRKNCGRKPMDWIDKKTQIQITIPNRILFGLTKQTHDDGKRAMSKLIQSNLEKVIESIAN